MSKPMGHHRSAVIEAQSISKSYQETTAVDKLNLELHEGECLALLGPNGAGKTTTCELLEGLQFPDAGSIHILGLTYQKDADAIRQQIGVLMQETTLYKKFTVRETLELFASFYKETADIDSLIKDLDLEEKKHSHLSSLSGGMRQRAYLACALVNRPKLLFLDEPTTGLDPTSRRNIWEVLKKIKSRGCSILLTTHYMEEASVLSDRIAIMDKGEIIASGTNDSLIREHCPGEILEVRLSEEMKADTIDQLSKSPDMNISTEDWQNLRINTENAASIIPTFYSLMGRAQVDRLAIHQSTLEDVFLKLAGRSIEENV